ncbi:MAG: hypothetical protein AAB295_03755 [Chloroflexota bacterium]
MNQNRTLTCFLTLACTMFVGLLFAASLPACSAAGVIQVSELRDLAEIIADRTEAYVVADTELQPAERGTSLSRIEHMRAVLVESSAEEVAGEVAAAAAEPVCELHDEYVASDQGLAAVDRTRALRSTQIMRRVLDAATQRSGP